MGVGSSYLRCGEVFAADVLSVSCMICARCHMVEREYWCGVGDFSFSLFHK